MRDACDVLCLDLPRAEALRKSRLSAELAADVARAARALSDPLRLQIAAALGDGDELCGCDLGWVLERSPALVSHHVRALRAAGLVGARRDGKLVMFSLTERGRALLGAQLAATEAA